MPRTVGGKDQSTSKRHCSDDRYLFEANIDYTSGNHPFKKKMDIDYPASATRHVRLSLDAWPRSYTYDLPGASRLDPDLLDLLLPRSNWTASLNSRYLHGLYSTTWTFDTAETTWIIFNCSDSAHTLILRVRFA